MKTSDHRQFIVGLEPPDCYALLAQLSEDERRKLEAHWPFWARPEQMPPRGEWRNWMVCAGRGFGKTRTGAEWVRNIAYSNPRSRIALVASSLTEARAVMVDGESGIMAVHGRGARPLFEASRRRLVWPNGAQATIYSAGEPESLRGPQHSHAWCDEIGKWDNSSNRAAQAWDNLQMGLRLGELPQALATTTPRAVPLVQRLFAEADKGDAVLTRGRTMDNAHNLPSRFVRSMHAQYGSSALGRQELDGELLTDIEGALWTRSLLERCRLPACLEDMVRIVVGVDPPASARGDECGIVVAGICADGNGHVLADASIGGASPERWASKVAAICAEWKADRVIAEANQGGDMVASVLRAADCQMPIRLVHASRGKSARAEPVAALYETGRVRHVGQFASLEDQLCGIMTGGSYEGPGNSPDRADAMVWAMTELMLSKRGKPAVRRI